MANTKKKIFLSITGVTLVILSIFLLYIGYNKKIIKPSFYYTGDATFSNNTLTITQAGTYTLSGYLEDGLIHVSAKKADVTLVLDNLEMNNSDRACIYVDKAKSVTIVLADGSVNTLSSGDAASWSDLEPLKERSTSMGFGGDRPGGGSTGDSDRSKAGPPPMDFEEDSDSEESEASDLSDDEKAVIYCKDDLTIQGSGSLTVNGYINNGIQCADNLVINSGCYEIKALASGILGRDSLTINDGSINIVSHKDALKSTNEDDAKGWVEINSGDITLASAKNGVHAESKLTINGGNINVTQSYEGLEGMFITVNDGNISIVSSDDGFNAYGGNSNFGGPGGNGGPGGPGGNGGPGGPGGNGGPGGHRPSDNQSSSDGSSNSTDSQIDENNHPMPPDFDASGNPPTPPDMNSDGSMPTPPDMDSDSSSSSSRRGPGGHGGPGGMSTDNKITLPSDGSGYSSIDDSEYAYTDSGISIDPASSDSDADSDPLPYLIINGGNIVVDAQGDGLDSNGDLIINGGYTIVHGPSNGGNGALDSGSESGGKILVHGGRIIAIGVSDMAETFEEGSRQAAIRTVDYSFEIGDTITISNDLGEELISIVAKTSGDSIVISDPDLNRSTAITVVIN